MGVKICTYPACDCGPGYNENKVYCWAMQAHRDRRSPVSTKVQTMPDTPECNYPRCDCATIATGDFYGQVIRLHCKRPPMNSDAHKKETEVRAAVGTLFRAGDSQDVKAGGVKFDADKLAFDLLPQDVLSEVAKVYTFGAKKYEPRNWERGMRYGRLYAALFRHVVSFWRGESIDQESGCHHLACATFCLWCLMAYDMRKGPKVDKIREEFDDRPKGENY